MRRIRFAIVMVLVISMLICPTSFAAGKTTKGVTAVKELSSNDVDDNMYLIVEVENLNGVDCLVSMDAYATTKNGNIIETVSTETIYLDAGGSYALVASFEDPASSKAYGYDYDLIVDTDLSDYDLESATKCIDAKFSDDAKGTVTIYATNTSKYTIEGEAIVIYYKKGNIADFERVILTNETDGLLYPGDTIKESVYTRNDYDESTMYITAVR